jgi:hypothetical protein
MTTSHSVQVQDKVAAFGMLSRLGLPQPEGTIVSRAAELRAWDRFPAFVKTPIGTATAGVWPIGDRRDLRVAAHACEVAGAFDQGGVLVQQAASGPLVMIQAVFAHGTLLAQHANLRLREGAGGGASHKESVDLPIVREHLRTLGDDLRWHGALSADAILTPDGPLYIDVNPRLVEPGNAWRAGVDLVGAVLDLACGRTPLVQAPGQPEVRTHQLLLAVLGAAQFRGRRRSILAELWCVGRCVWDAGPA